MPSGALQVNLVEAFQVQPGESQEVVVLFRPRKDRADSGGDEDEEPTDVSTEDKHYHYFQVRGKVFLSACIVPSSGQNAADVVTAQEKNIRMEANCCLSVLRVDTRSITFDDSIPGGEYWKDFTVWNLSEVPCSFSLDHCSSMRDDVFQFMIETEESGPLKKLTAGSPVAVDGLSHIRVSVRFRPQGDESLGEDNYTVEIENHFNGRNVEVISVLTIVAKERQADGLQVSVGSELDFGDCYTGVGSERNILLRNMTDEVLFVTFSNDHDDGTVSIRMQDSDGPKKSPDSATRNEESVGAEKQDRSGELAAQSTLSSVGTMVKKNDLQELFLKPGQQKMITCTFRPPRLKQQNLERITLKSKPISRKLKPLTFRMWLRCHDDTDRVLDKYSKMLLCRARVCTSWLLLEKRVINFGDTNVGANVAHVMQVVNLSDLPATLSLYSSSQVLFFHPAKATIPARQTLDIKIQFTPKFLDPNFEKIVRFINADNVDNAQTLEVRANITDQHRVTFHSLFYSVQVPNRAANEVVFFGDCAAQSKVARMVKVANKSDVHGLSLELKTDSEEFRLFRENDVASNVAANSAHESFTGTAGTEKSQSNAGMETHDKIEAVPSQKFRGIKQQLLEGPLMNPLMNPDASERHVNRIRATAAAQRRRRDSFDKDSMPVAPDYRMANEQDLAVAQFNHSTVHEARSASPKAQRALPRSSPPRVSRTVSPDSPSTTGARTLSDVFEEVANDLQEEQDADDCIGRSVVNGYSIGDSNGGADTKTISKEMVPKKRDEDRTELQRLVDVQSSLTSFEDSTAEVQHVLAAIEQRDLTERLLQQQQLIPLQKLDLLPGAEQTIYIMFEGSPMTGSDAVVLQNRSAKILFHLERYELGIATAEGVEVPKVIPVREVPLRARVCESRFSVQQSSINFGKMSAHEQRVRFMILTNQSAVPLLYDIQKTGSIDSQNMQIGNKAGSSAKGVVRPFSTAQIPFFFKPTFHNKAFFQTIKIENIRNKMDVVDVNVKAEVLKPNSFELHTKHLDFGPTLVNERSKTLRLVLNNTTPKFKYYTLEAVLEELDENFPFRVDLYFQLDMTERVRIDEKTTATTELQVDALQQQIKKFRRKGKKDKVKQAERDLRRLNAILDQGQSGSDSETEAFDSLSDSEDEDSGDEHLEKIKRYSTFKNGKRGPPNAFKNDARPRKNGVTFGLKPQGMQVVFATFVARARHVSINKPREATSRATAKLVSGYVRSRDTQNVEMFKDIEVMATICPSHSAFLQVVGKSNSKAAAKDLPQNRQLVPKDVVKVKASKKLPQVDRPSAPLLESVLYATPERVELGRATVLMEASGSFEIKNSSASPQNFIVMISDDGKKTDSKKKRGNGGDGDKDVKRAKDRVSVRVVPNSGIVPPFGSQVIQVYYVPHSSGKHERPLLLRNFQNGGKYDTPITVAATASHPEYLRCPDTDTDQKLNLGECYIDPARTYAKVTPFRLHNVHEADVHVLLKSNLSSQVFVFHDAELQQAASDYVKLPPGATATFYIALRPSAVGIGKSNKMVGGIRAEMQSADGIQLEEKTYKFEAIMTMSMLRLSASTVVVGASHRLGEKNTGTFTIENLTEERAVDFEIAQPSWAFIAPLQGQIRAANEGRPNSIFKVEYAVVAEAYGYLSEEIVITNKMCPSQKLTVEIKLFVDDMSLQSNLPCVDGIAALNCNPIYIYAPFMPKEPSAVKPDKTAGVVSRQFDWENAVMKESHMKFTLQNKLDTAIAGLQPVSTIDASISTRNVDQDTAFNSSGAASPLFLDSKNQQPTCDREDQSTALCGDAFDLAAGQVQQLCCSVQSIGPNLASSDALPKLRKGLLIPVEGLLLFKRPMLGTTGGVCTCPLPWHLDSCQQLASRTAKTISIRAMAGMTLGKLVSKNVHLGTVGIINSWKPVEFSFSIQNLCEIPLVFTVSSFPSCFSIECENGTVPCQSTLECKAILRPADLQNLRSSSHAWASEILIGNDHNPYNIMKLKITADVMSTLLQFTRVEGYSISLPPLSIPSTEPAVDQWFAVENITDMPLELHLTTNLNEDADKILSLDVQARASSVKLTKVKLDPSEEVEVRLVARPQRGVRVVPLSCMPNNKQESGANAPDVDTIQATESTSEFEVDLGELKIRIMSEVAEIDEILQLRGSLQQGETFSLSKKFLHLHLRDGIGIDENDQLCPEAILNDQFEIRNLSAEDPLEFCISTIESFGHENEKSVVTILPHEGIISADGAVNVTIQVDPSGVETLDDICANVKIVVSDRSVENSSAVISLNCTGWVAEAIDTDDTMSRHQSSASLQPESSPLKDRIAGSSASLQAEGTSAGLVLQGCTPVAYSSHRFQIDLGQQALSSDKIVSWELSLSNMSAEAQEYRIFPMADVSNWMTLSHTRGFVNPLSSTKVMLSLRVNKLGKYSTYLVLENCANSADLQTVQIRMEVVAQSLAWKDAFDVIIDGKSSWQSTPVINLGNCFIGREYRNRSFVICNNSHQKLDFVVKGNMEESDEFALDFSLTNTSLKKFRSLTIPAQSSQRVYMFFRVHDGSPVGTHELDISVSCRLIKFHQIAVQLRANYCQPQLAVANRKQIAFTATPRLKVAKAAQLPVATTPTRKNIGLDRETEVDIVFNHSKHTMVVTNHSDSVVDVLVRNDTMFFLITSNLLADTSHGPPKQYILRESDSFEGKEHFELARQNESVDSGDDDRQPDETAKEDSALDMDNTDTDAYSQLYVGAREGIIPFNRMQKQICNTLFPGQKLAITVKPNRESIDLMYENIMQEKYVEEHVTIYNRNNPTEHRLAYLRLSFVEQGQMGDRVDFYSAPGRSKSYSFQILEETVVQFLRSFHGLFGKVVERVELSVHDENSTGICDGRRSPPRDSVERSSVERRRGEARPFRLHGKWYSDERRAQILKELAVVEKTPSYSEIVFELFYITDELVYKALKDPVGSSFVFQLANLLYSVCLQHDVFESSRMAADRAALNTDLDTDGEGRTSGSNSSDLSNLGGVASGGGSNHPPSPPHGFSDKNVGSSNGGGNNSSGITGASGMGWSGNDAHLYAQEFPSMLRCWVLQLTYFLSFFPDKEDDLRPLRGLVVGGRLRPKRENLSTDQLVAGSGRLTDAESNETTEYSTSTGAPRLPSNIAAGTMVGTISVQQRLREAAEGFAST
eukprot:SAG31_NODE_245_length_19224_cov_10.210614_7_plen_3161_part_00